MTDQPPPPQPTTPVEHTKESAVALYLECIGILRHVSAKLAEVQGHHPIAALIKRALDKALQYAPPEAHSGKP